jgi:hypothetical protein
MTTSLQERVRRLTDWAKNRIAHQKYRMDGPLGPIGQMEQAAAMVEVRTLEAVLAQLAEEA